MGKFANETEGQGHRIGPPVEVPGTSGFDAFGKPVSQYRRDAAYQTLKEIGVTDPEKRFSCVGRMAECVERDQPHQALELALEYVDVTGAYRILAVLCTAEKAR